MKVQSILSVVGISQGNRDLELAAEICGDANAHLSVLLMSRTASMPIGAYADVISDAWYVERQHDAKRLQKRVSEVTELVAAKAISADISGDNADYALVADGVGRRARHTDLTLLGPSLMADETIRDQVIDGAMFRSGRPVLLVPETQAASLTPEAICIAWDGSLEATTAIGFSLDLLAAAKDVRVVLVDPVAGDERHGAEPGADLAAYLARHGIKVTVDVLASAGRLVSDVLTRHAADVNCGLIVMGAYGHSRLRERIFGGVTQSMLSRVTVPLLMAH
jgi:nucleotide-binding universal stress UspA family protein